MIKPELWFGSRRSIVSWVRDLKHWCSETLLYPAYWHSDQVLLWLFYDKGMVATLGFFSSPAFVQLTVLPLDIQMFTTPRILDSKLRCARLFDNFSTVCMLIKWFIFSLPIYKRFLARSIHNSPHQQSRTSCFPKDCFAAPQIVSYCPNYICSTNCQCLSNVCLSGQTVRSLITTNTCMTQTVMWFMWWMQGTDGKTNEAVLQALACGKVGGGGAALTLDVHWVSSIPEAGIQYKN